jgi:hypothetical protein
MQKVHISLVVIVASLLLGCAEKEATTRLSAVGGASFAPIRPESLIDISSENVTIPIVSHQNVEDVTQWLAKEVPSAARLSCYHGNAFCDMVREKLTAQQVEIEETHLTINSKEAPSVVLIYEAMQVRDCAVDGAPMAFGCASSVNALEMISDRTQLVEPDLSGLPDAGIILKSMQRSAAANAVIPAAEACE